jgi:hypothetical protein
MFVLRGADGCGELQATGIDKGHIPVQGMLQQHVEAVEGPRVLANAEVLGQFTGRAAGLLSRLQEPADGICEAQVM